MEYNHAAIMVTENCNAKCKMCCDSRGRVEGITLSMDDIDLILDNIKNYKYISSIGLTGGEPMLRRDICEYIMNYNFGRIIRFTIKTNGFWGRNVEHARNFIEKYRDKISLISFSYDEFHAEYINLDYIKNIIDICIDNSIKTEIVGCFLQNGLQPGDIINKLGKYAFLTDYCYQPVIETGAARTIDGAQYIKILDTTKQCIWCLVTAAKEYSILINTKLEVYPCCSQCVENTVLKVGSLKNKSLSEIVMDIKTNRILYTIFTEGFTPFLRYLEQNNISYPKELSSHCEMCEYLFKTDWFMKELKNGRFYSYKKI